MPVFQFWSKRTNKISDLSPGPISLENLSSVKKILKLKCMREFGIQID